MSTQKVWPLYKVGEIVRFGGYGSVVPQGKGTIIKANQPDRLWNMYGRSYRVRRDDTGKTVKVYAQHIWNLEQPQAREEG